MLFLRRYLWGALLCACCSSAALPVAHTPVEHIEVPGEVTLYSTDAAPNGVIGGEPGEALARDVATELKKRGDAAVPDGALAATASWVLRELNKGRVPTYAARDAAAQRFGFAGVIVAHAGFPLDAEHHDDWRKAIAMVPRNMQLNRYGVSFSPSGRCATVVLGAVELSLEPFARHLSLGDKLNLRGKISARYAFAHASLTKTDGTVEERLMPSRKVDASFSFTQPGIYQIEVTGDGATGSVIVSNVPLFVGVKEDEVVASTGSTTAPAQAEARMFELLNQSRKTASLEPLQLDEELRAIALAHATDMAEHQFASHVSPTLGTLDERVNRSRAVLADFGENIALTSDAETAHDGLMASPGHRENMLRPTFTHVGIAAVRTASNELIFTLIFGRRPDPSAMPRTAEQVEAAFLARRRKKGLPIPTSDPLYRAAVTAGVAAYVAASTPTDEIASQVAQAVQAREVERTGSQRPPSCVLVSNLLELAQLDQIPALLAPTLIRYGLAARIRQDSHGTRLVVMIQLDGVPCQ